MSRFSDDYIFNKWMKEEVGSIMYTVYTIELLKRGDINRIM